MNISKARLRRELGPTLDHLSENPERDFEDLYALLTGNSRPSVKLRVADELLQGHGVESLRDERATESHGWLADYVNTGDSYGVTLVWSQERGIEITSYGDFVERWERKLPREQRTGGEY